jgi:outer membrane protein
MYPTRNHFPVACLVFVLVLVSSFSAKAQKIWTLEDCINYALENNLDIKKQVQLVQSNKENLLQSGLSMLPTIDAGGSNVWNFGQTINQFTNTFATSKTLNDNFYLQAQLTIFGGLQKFNSVKQNQIDLMASKYDLDVLKNNISVAVAGFYLDILFNSELLEVAKSQLAITKDQVTRIGKMVEAGSSARGDLLTIQAQQATEELQVVNAQNALNISYLSLQQLIDFPVDPNFVVEKPNLKLIQPPIDVITAESIYEKALAVRPEIKSAELAVQSKQKQLAIARSGYSPVLSFGGSWGTGYSGASQQPNPDIPPVLRMDTTGITTVSHDYVVSPSYTYTYQPVPFNDQLHNNENKSLGLYLNIPIFNGWQVQNSVAQAKIQQNIADLDLESAKRDLRKKIEQAYADAVAALKKYNTSLEKVNAQEESFKYTSQKFDVGVMTSFDYNNSKKDLTAAQSDLLQAKYDFIFKTTILDFYVGNPIRIVRE